MCTHKIRKSYTLFYSNYALYNISSQNPPPPKKKWAKLENVSALKHKSVRNALQ